MFYLITVYMNSIELHWVLSSFYQSLIVEFFAFIKGAALSMGKSLYCAIHEEKERIIIKSFTNDFDKEDMTDLLEEVVEW